MFKLSFFIQKFSILTYSDIPVFSSMACAFYFLWSSAQTRDRFLPGVPGSVQWSVQLL